MEHYDIIVVGAGLSGLRAATLLKRAGYSIRVLEAQERVGGRLKGVKDGSGMIWDLGGQWIGPQQRLMNKLLEEYQIQKYYQYDDTRENLVFLDSKGNRSIYNAQIGVYPEGFNICINKLNELAQQLPLHEPWKHPQAEYWDSITVSRWMKLEFPDQNVLPGNSGLKGFLASEENEVSLLYLLICINSARGARDEVGCHDYIALTRGGAQESKIVGSAWGLCNTIYEKDLKDNVIFNCVVSKIYHDQSGCIVVTRDPRVYRASHVVITVPPNMVNRIQFSPRPILRSRLTESLPMASVIKIVVKYTSAYWHQKGYSGLSISYERDGVGLTYDASVTLPSGKFQPALVAFILGKSARIWSERTLEERQKKVIKDLALIFDDDRLLLPQEYIDQDWCAEDFVGGGFTCIAPPGVLVNYGDTLSPPIGRLHWAGTESSDRWSGYMEGALSSAEKVVGEIWRSSRSLKANM